MNQIDIFTGVITTIFLALGPIFLASVAQIDTFKEKIISLDTAAKHCAKIRGKKIHRNALLRWANRGISGVKLPTILIGGEIMTSREGLNSFLNESRQAKRNRHSSSTAAGIRSVSLDQSSEADSLGI